MIIAGTDTTIVSTTWALSLLVNNRRALKKAQQELDTHVGKSRHVEESDAKNLTYLQAIVKETMRLYPPAPVIGLRSSMEDCTFSGGFRILAEHYSSCDGHFDSEHHLGTIAASEQPRVLKKAQQELDTHVGKSRHVEESDVKNLTYLQAIVKETLRLYPPAPIVGLRSTMEDCTFSGGFRIPAGTRLLFNYWKIQRDERVWSNPEEFEPERFLTTHANVDVRGQNFELIPFGAGRRSCAGTSLALHTVHLTLASLLQSFEINTVSDEPVDMTEGPGLTNLKTTPLEVLLIPRLDQKVYERDEIGYVIFFYSLGMLESTSAATGICSFSASWITDNNFRSVSTTMRQSGEPTGPPQALPGGVAPDPRVIYSAISSKWWVRGGDKVAADKGSCRVDDGHAVHGCPWVKGLKGG
ncbi:hypothetical protein NL676_023004 [Syzygium grande]|nr:hypothetical protein NL676_023004 [Syzygium grande]